MTNSKKISVTILLKGTPKRFKEVLEALKEFSEVILYDNGASWETIAISQQFNNVRLIKGDFIGFGPTHNAASALAINDWILSVDSDEVLTRALFEEIQKLSLDPCCIYGMPRHNQFNERWIRWCGWNPDRVFRLYHRFYTQFTNVQVHETIESTGFKKVILRAALMHYSYETLSDFLTKMQSYSDLFAKEHVGKRSSSPFKACTHALAAFLKSYFVKKGFLGGYEGFFISMYNSHTAFYKYLKLYEANCCRMRRCPDENAARLSSSSDAQK